MLKLAVTFLMTILLSVGFAQQRYDAIYSGIPWLDDRGKMVSTHGANMIKDGNRYYLFGEAHSDTSNAFAGFNCYSSADLYNWKWESIALPVQKEGKLGPNRVGERCKVMKCPSTGEYIMYMHVDTLTYKDQFTGYATSKNITGPYVFQGPLLFNDKPIRKWDMGTFQDWDGSGYVLLHGGDIYKLSNDYKSIAGQVNKAMTSGFEAPTLFRKDSLYYFMGSDLTSWEKNDNYYYTATSLSGPWVKKGFVAPEGSLTWNSQCTFVLPIAGSKDTTYMFMGDRWSFPKQASAATYVWQPITVSGHSLSILTYQEAWKINRLTGRHMPAVTDGKIVANTIKKAITYKGNWQDTASLKRSNEKGASFSISFTGTKIGWYGLSAPNSGYAEVKIHGRKSRLVLTSLVDMYSKAPVLSLKFMSPLLPKDQYTLTVTVAGEKPNWSDKKRSDYGSTGYFISLDKFVY